jgi:RsiW-degrading membrane proteinase PrsW (M82 family)
MNASSDETPIPSNFWNSLWTFIVAIAFIGPFALPLLWRNPRYSKMTKAIVSVAIIVLTIYLLWLSGSVITQLNDAYKKYQELQRF